ncbi:MAG: glycosyltransferase family protein [Candidatus Nanopusillus sp.]
MKKKVYLSINGIGYGHSARNLLLIKELLKRGYLVYISTYNEGYEFLKKYFKNIYLSAGFNLILTEEGILSVKLTLAKQFFSSIIKLFLQIITEMRNLIHINPNYIIVDSRISTAVAARLLRMKYVLILNQFYLDIPRIKKMNKLIKFLKRISERILYEILFTMWIYASYLIIPDLKPPYTICSYSIKLKDKQYLHKLKFVGNIIHNQRIVKNKKISEKICCTVILSGNLQERSIMFKSLLKIIKKIKNEDIYINILTGLNFIKKTRINSAVIYGWIKDEEKSYLINEANILIVNGGHSTLIETLQYKKPYLILLLKGHTEKFNNSRKIKELGIGEYIFIDELNEIIFLNKIKEMYENKEKYENNIKNILKYLNNDIGFILDLVYYDSR